MNCKSIISVLINLVSIYLNYLIITILCDPMKLNYYSDKYIVVDRKNYTEQLGYVDAMVFNYKAMEYHYKEQLTECIRMSDIAAQRNTECVLF